jgi:YYY domain-containing protein
VSWFIPTLWWYVVTLLATIACLPVTLFFFRRTVGQGAAFARPVAMLVAIWPAWFLSGILPGLGVWTQLMLWAFLGLVAVIGWLRVARLRAIDRDTIFHHGVAELIHLVVFAGALWFRGYGPNADFTEKPGELMMLSSVMQSTSMPPHDAWLAGHDLNYYYIGYAIWGGFGKITALAPAEVFNLALVSTFAMAFVAVSGLVATVLGRFHGTWAARIGGGIAGFMALVMGNPWASWKWLQGEAGAGYWGDGIGWNASRIIRDSPDPDYGYNPITEFPSFSFVLGDLHPHVMALPFAATALGLAWMLLTMGPSRDGESVIRREAARITLAGAFIGALYAINSWDFPTYAGIAILALLIGTVGIGWRKQLGAVAMFAAAAILAWLPFHLNFDAPSNPIDSPIGTALGWIPVVGGVLESVGLYQGLATTPGAFFSIFGFQYAVMLALILGEVVRRRQPVFSQRLRRQGEQPYTDPLSGYFALGFGVLCFIGAIMVPIPLLMFCGLPVIVIWLLLERDARLTPSNISLVLFALALLLLLIPEFFYISDIYTGSRMNTVFKVSYQVWLLMSVAVGIGAVALWKSIRFNAVLRYAVPVAGAALLVYGLVYPVVGGQQWLDWRNPNRDWVGIDGLAYLNANPDSPQAAEYEAIQWLHENADEDDVILTAGGGEWDSAVGRVSSGSGVPTVMGWIGHEDQWHLGDAALLSTFPQRITDIDAMYQLPLNAELLNQYGVTLIYIGPNEVHGAPGQYSYPQPGRMSTTPVEVAGSPEFPGEGWELVFEQGDVRIYRLIED